MKSACVVLALAAAVLPEHAGAAGAVERFALVVGANQGGSDRQALHYAVTDAERFARVLAELGGVRPESEILLRQPKLGELDAALESLRVRVAEARRAGGRTELVVYYSGHADDKGLLLGEDRYSYRSLRDRLDQVPADVRIAVLDACGSGAITRLKGGRPQPAFLIDESSDMRGQAILTSSAATEAAQESDRIGGSYFTHYLVSGLRGAADTSGEGKVTLNEAYQFAFGETLGRTVDSSGGPQHPSYDINLSGTGDVVITDLRQTSATLVLGDAVDGRVFVRNARQELVVELNKPLGRTIALALEAGTYDVRVERDARLLVARPQLAEGARVVLDGTQFTPSAKEPTQRRGGPPPPPFAVAGRNRLEIRLGMFDVSHAEVPGRAIVSGTTSTDVHGGLRYTRYLNDRLAMTLGVDLLASTSGVATSADGTLTGETEVVSIPLGVRFNPMGGARETQVIKPYIDLMLGPVVGTSAAAVTSGRSVEASAVNEVAMGGLVGGGVDFHVTRGFSVGLSGGYQWTSDFSQPVASRVNYSGFEAALNFGWVFGKGFAVHD